MVADRAAFLGSGHYDGVTAALAEAVLADGPPHTLLDLGGGTGHHLAAILDRVPEAVGVVLDASPYAARRAARAHPRAMAVVADSWARLPVLDGVLDRVLVVFAPRNGPEIARVLRPGGRLVVVTPAADHLAELVGPLGLLRVDPRKAERTATALESDLPADRGGLPPADLELDRSAVRGLVGMGPHARHLVRDDLRARLAAFPEQRRVTVSVEIAATSRCAGRQIRRRARSAGTETAASHRLSSADVTIAPAPIVSRPSPAHVAEKGSRLSNLLRTTDHKTIGLMYLVTSFICSSLGGLMAMLMRGELARPGLQFLSPEQYNQLFTMHGTVMLLFFATPLFFAFAQPDHAAADRRARRRVPAAERALVLAVPLRQHDRAWPGFLTPGGAADFGWTAYTPLSDVANSPGAGGNLWIAGLAVSGLGTILGGVNFITTIVCLRAPGMTLFRMPIFTWNALVTSVLILLAFPILTAALMALLADRNLGALVYTPRERRADAVAAPVLVLRAPRGLHHRAAVLRHRHRDHPGVQPQAAVRLQGHGLRDPRHRRPVAGGVGAPHVRHRRGAAALLRLPDLPDRRADRHQVLQLDRHHVARAS